MPEWLLLVVHTLSYSCSCQSWADLLSCAGTEHSSGNMDENGEMVEIRARSNSFPIALMALPVKPQSTWTLEPEHAQNIRGGQVTASSSYAASLQCAAESYLHSHHVPGEVMGFNRARAMLPELA